MDSMPCLRIDFHDGIMLAFDSSKVLAAHFFCDVITSFVMCIPRK